MVRDEAYRAVLRQATELRTLAGRLNLPSEAGGPDWQKVRFYLAEATGLLTAAAIEVLQVRAVDVAHGADPECAER
ncbi:MAG: hypothetical protein LLG20_24195 [Acidobacteriales bacterium]|nr:hypothetical protein [Terriglobales bacterium]